MSDYFYYVEKVNSGDYWEYVSESRFKTKAIEDARALEKQGKIVRVLKTEVIYNTEEVS
jgi:hypothetical protein